MSNIDWSKLITKEMKEAEVAALKRAADVIKEDAWRVEELVEIADQLIAIEDEDPAAMPGTDRQWRDYRTKVRNWKEGAVNFPDSSFRPLRP